ncbi:hypothetical protein IMF27_18625 [Pseudomonas sp. PCH199]|uniref:hypothetical protein n=1 Tax=unclassified Pseudomonas TaxID=196821 RepID=UPI000BD9E061|nr:MULTISPECIES: hypothetical protein [unclassified Pseudomonas]MCW8277398.1 hypothetical protein [Pseudomonas sp. PCH199]PAM82336.1 hypothetical protein CES87_18990 [Pseudomonas sp. ERMR1:02]
MSNDDRVKPLAPSVELSHEPDSDGADESMPSPQPPPDEPEAGELQRKVDEIQRKVADGN